MTLNNLFDQIESVQYESELAIANGFRVFQRALIDNEITRSLVQHLQQHPGDSRFVFERLLTLLSTNDQPEYAHPSDAAIAGYLYSLREVDTILANMAASRVSQTSQLWWAKKLARQMLEGDISTTSKQFSFGAKHGPGVVFSSQDAACTYSVHSPHIYFLVRFSRVETRNPAPKLPLSPYRLSSSTSTRFDYSAEGSIGRSLERITP